MSKETILYVDDEELARKYFLRAFEAEYEVLSAASADEAIAILRADNRVAILVTDYRMPGRDGGDLLRQIALEFPHLPRILLTAYAEREVLLDAVNSGEIFRIIEKPLDLPEVGKALRQAAELSRERRLRQQKLQAIDETIAFLAHELNTPLAAIGNFADGIVARAETGKLSPPEIGKAANEIAGNARYCYSLLSAFFDSVRAAGSHPSAAGFSAQGLISSLLDTYPLSTSQREAIEVEIRDDFPIHEIPNCIHLVLSSLLKNALYAVREQAAPKISIVSRIDGNPQISIEDNGPGVPAEIGMRLFAEPVTSHPGDGGHGWGLIFSNRIMQSVGGGIQLHSSADGTAVTLNFSNKRSDQ